MSQQQHIDDLNDPRLTPYRDLKDRELAAEGKLFIAEGHHVVERLLKALREARPATVRQFFALAGQHTRWELNDLARRLDRQPRAGEVVDDLVPAPASSASGLSPDGRRMIEAIDALPADEREAFDLVRIQGMTQAEAAAVLGVSTMTVNRRLNSGLQLLADALADLDPQGIDPNPT